MADESIRDAEREFTARLLELHSAGDSDVLLTVDPAHFWTQDYRDVITEMQRGIPYVDLLHGKHRETVIALLGATSGYYSDDLYRIIKDGYIRREIKRAQNVAGQADYGLDELLELSERLRDIEASVSERRRSNAAEKFADRLMSERAIIPTGIRCLDSALGGGFELTEKVVIAARPSGGKTSFACFLARLIAEGGEPVAFWSIESPDDQIMRRVLASKHRLTISAIKDYSRRHPTLSDSQVAMLIESAKQLQASGLNILDSSGRTSRQVATEIISAPERVCFVDHLQKFRGADMKMSVGDASAHLAHAANAKRKVVVMLSQLSRNIENRASRDPQLSDLKESGDIEQDADTIIFIQNMSEDAEGREDVTSNEVDIRLVIAKRRDGGRGAKSMRWNRATGEFYERDYEHQPVF